MPQFDEETVGEWRITWMGHMGDLVGTPDPPPLTLVAQKLDDETQRQEVVLEGLSPQQVEEKLLPILRGETHDFIRRHSLDDPNEYGGRPDSG